VCIYVNTDPSHLQAFLNLPKVKKKNKEKGKEVL
jgi:hypothetical protein